MQAEVKPDYTKTLDMLNTEWEDCTRCALGKQRDSMNALQAFGEGEPGGIMFISGGPGEPESIKGRPFVGPSGSDILKPVIDALGIFDISFITNLVVCRSCSQMHDGQGQPMFERENGVVVPRWRDEDPNAQWIVPCMPRLIEEIYLVDPVLIVALGRPAAETLRGKPVAITRDRGTVEEITIPGATLDMVLTEKKQVWARKLNDDGTFQTVSEQSKVKYLMMPTFNPTFIARNVDDTRPAPEGPFQTFAADVRMAAKIFERFNYEITGMRPSGASDNEIKNPES